MKISKKGVAVSSATISIAGSLSATIEELGRILLLYAKGDLHYYFASLESTLLLVLPLLVSLIFLVFCYENLVLINAVPGKQRTSAASGNHSGLVNLTAIGKSLVALIATSMVAYKLLNYPFWQAVVIPGSLFGVAMWYWTKLAVESRLSLTTR